MSSITPPTHNLAAHTFGRHHFSPPPLPERLERIQPLEMHGTQPETSNFSAPAADLDQRIREVGEW